MYATNFLYLEIHIFEVVDHFVYFIWRSSFFENNNHNNKSFLVLG